MQERQKKIHTFGLDASITLPIQRLDARVSMLYPFLSAFFNRNSMSPHYLQGGEKYFFPLKKIKKEAI